MSQFMLGARGHDFPQNTPETLFKAMAEQSLYQVQLAPKKSFGYPTISAIDTSAIGQALTKHKMQVAVYGCYVEIALVNTALRQPALEEYLRSMEVAKELGSGCIACETTCRDLQPEVGQRECFYTLCKSLEVILTRAQELDLTVCIEPVWNHTIHTPQAVSHLLKTLRSPNMGIVFDPANLVTPDNMDSQEDLWKQCLEHFGASICAVHIKGIRPQQDGGLGSCSLSQSVLRYPALFESLRTVRRALPVLREEIQMDSIAQDRAFLQMLF